MATYAIGDIQGCFDALQRLLRLVRFDHNRDRLWFVGDLVNRGSDSLAVLRFVQSLGERAVTILGNHDLHLLCVAAGVQQAHPQDTLTEILAAPDCDALLDWLRRRPLVHLDGDYLMVHAGLLPQWDIEQSVLLGQQVSEMLSGGHYKQFMEKMYGNRPDQWSDSLAGWDRLRVIVNAMTRMRICTPQGRMEFAHKSSVARIPEGFLPWYAVPGRRSAAKTVLFGHWSAHGFRRQHNVVALDTGCLWGGCLSALRLEDRLLFQVGCREYESLRAHVKQPARPGDWQ